ncbi:MAG TPA: S-methyl-5-thioribose-1-phosphate isomerase [Candidatus Coprenecus stercoravium]|uniref:Methylthioribose-1-phosphate isomerase n=1 Tax=Candidatus Coprenecus stercoravium TaxID=2840735 RepID=A0A9D2GPR3_9BACT|nr:S-methyl-5-thioribose-1-phosphate isomerase [Candidatus Coprenecus stercoravium]
MDGLFKYDCVSLDADGSGVTVLDQTLLPWEEKFLVLRDEAQVYEAIARLRVRGAPAIGIAAAYGLYVAFRRAVSVPGFDQSQCRSEFYRISRFLCSARPTAVNLSAALSRMERRFEASSGRTMDELLDALRSEADAVKSDDAAMCAAIAENGAALIDRPGMGILTHCNAGHYAVSRYGTALAPVYLAHSRGLAPRVYADETRPLMQGARITAFELMKAGVDVTLQCDNMAASLMASGKIDLVLTGCDRVAANGDTANKIGTSALAVLARYYGLPFYILGPTSSIDPDAVSGADIPVEQRPAEEVTELYFHRRIAPEGVKVYNPAFDITPSELISGIVTERGIFRPPYDFSNLKLDTAV